jgi:CRP/FNR family transcriptional regulator, cyclic AMP receptor protein
MLERTPHQTNAIALDDSVCLEVKRDDFALLLQRKPDAGMDMLTVLGRQVHAAQELVRNRALRNPNEVIEEEASIPERIADSVARFGGSWSFITTFALVLAVYTAANVVLGRSAWDPYPFILLNLFLSMLAAIQAPVIMMSQDAKDSLRGELDYNVNRRAESEIQGLARQVNLLSAKIDDIEDLLRQRLPRSEGCNSRPVKH